MRFLRTFLRDHYRLALALVALALCLKAMVPSGFMVGGAGKALTITICGQSQGLDSAVHIQIPAPGQSHDDHGDQGHASDVCPYSALAMAALSDATVPLLALALAFILALGLLPVASPPPAARAFLRPPLRAPPALG